MSTSSVADLELKKNSRNKGFMAGLARQLVFAQLKKLHTGRLLIQEGQQEYVFGQSLETCGELNATLVIHDSAAYSDIMTGGSIGAAEAYMTADWSTPDLTMLVRVMVRNTDILDQMEGGLALLSKPFLKLFHYFNQNSQKGSRRNIAAHYDLGNDLFELFLDPTMMYSSGIFPHEGASMEQASIKKLDTICQKLDLSADDHVVEIGTGWGGFAIYAAQNYGCKVTTTTISQQQYNLARQRVEDAGLSDQITLLLEDYRDLRKDHKGQFDKLVSIEMIEAVGWQFYETFFEHCADLLKPQGLALIQAITIAEQRYDQARNNVDFIQRYIFPGSCIPSISALTKAAGNASDLNLVQAQDFGLHYAKTLRAWHDEFNRRSDEVSELGYSDDFKRMWQFYLSYCEGGFQERSIGVNHLVFGKDQWREKVSQS